MTAITVAFVCTLAYRFNVLLSLLRTHLDQESGEILPHLLMADIERWAEAEVLKGDHARRAQIQAMLNFLEEAYSTGDANIQELISVSFLEHLPRPGASGSEIRSMLSPNLKQQLMIIG